MKLCFVVRHGKGGDTAMQQQLVEAQVGPGDLANPGSNPTLTPARYIMAVKIYKSSGCPIIRREACM